MAPGLQSDGTMVPRTSRLLLALASIALIPAAAAQARAPRSKVSRLTVQESQRYQAQPSRCTFKLSQHRLPFRVETRWQSHSWGDVKKKITICDHGPEALETLNHALQGSAANKALAAGKPLRRYYRAVSPQELDEPLNKGAAVSPVARRWRHLEWRGKGEAYVRDHPKQAMDISMGSLAHNYRAGPRKAELERAQQRALRTLPANIVVAKTPQEYTETGQAGARGPGLRPRRYVASTTSAAQRFGL